MKEYKTLQIELKEGVAVFTMNNPPVNQLSQHFVLELADAFSEAFGDETIKAIVLTGTGAIDGFNGISSIISNGFSNVNSVIGNAGKIKISENIKE